MILIITSILNLLFLYFLLLYVLSGITYVLSISATQNYTGIVVGFVIIVILIPLCWKIANYFRSKSNERYKKTIQIIVFCNWMLIILIICLSMAPFFVGNLYHLTYPFDNPFISNNVIYSKNLTTNFLFYTNNQEYLNCLQNFSINTNISCNFISTSGGGLSGYWALILSLTGLLIGYIIFLAFVRQKSNFFYGIDEIDASQAKYYYSFFHIAGIILVLAFVILILFSNPFLTEKLFEMFILMVMLFLCITEMASLVYLKQQIGRKYTELEKLIEILDTDEKIKSKMKELAPIELWTTLLSLLTVYIFIFVHFTLITVLTLLIVIIINSIAVCQLLNLPKEKYQFILKNDQASDSDVTGYIILEKKDEFWILNENNQVIYIMKDSVNYIRPQQTADNSKRIDALAESPHPPQDH